MFESRDHIYNKTYTWHVTLCLNPRDFYRAHSNVNPLTKKKLTKAHINLQLDVVLLFCSLRRPSILLRHPCTCILRSDLCKALLSEQPVCLSVCVIGLMADVARPHLPSSLPAFPARPASFAGRVLAGGDPALVADRDKVLRLGEENDKQNTGRRCFFRYGRLEKRNQSKDARWSEPLTPALPENYRQKPTHFR